MFKIEIVNKSSKQITNLMRFETEQECLSWFNELAPTGVFGNPEQPELKELQDVLITPAVLDPETGEELEPAVYEQQEVVVRPYTPAEYEIVIEEIPEKTPEQIQDEEDIRLGAIIEERCLKAKRYITGRNTRTQLTIEQVSEMVSTYEPIKVALADNRVDLATTLLNEIDSEDSNIQEIKTKLLLILQGLL